MMSFRNSLAAMVAVIVLLAASGCAVTRGQESVGAYIDDAAITTAVKGRMIDNPAVDAAAISVETMQGTVMLTGFAKNTTEREVAESLARKTDGVKSVKNEILIRP